MTRGIRRVPSRRSTIQRTTGVRMYAINPANTNGSSTSRPRIRISTTNSGKPQRDTNRRAGLASPNQVWARLRATAPEIGCVIDPVIVVPAGAPLAPEGPAGETIDGSLGRASPGGSADGSIGVTARV